MDDAKRGEKEVFPDDKGYLAKGSEEKGADNDGSSLTGLITLCISFSVFMRLFFTFFEEKERRGRRCSAAVRKW